jgi:hypothetical protein
MAPNRNRHQPGRDNDSHESRQHKKIGQDAKIKYINQDKVLASPAAAIHMKNNIADGESRQSISASKKREMGRGTGWRK